ncbi:hypothetical protein NFI96_012360, partial [Prochilodus magdalenae]
SSVELQHFRTQPEGVQWSFSTSKTQPEGVQWSFGTPKTQPKGLQWSFSTPKLNPKVFSGALALQLNPKWSFGTPKLNPKVFSGASALPKLNPKDFSGASALQDSTRRSSVELQHFQNSTRRSSVELRHSQTQPKGLQWSFGTPKTQPKGLKWSFSTPRFNPKDFSGALALQLNPKVVFNEAASLRLNPKEFSGASALPNSTQRSSVELRHSQTQPKGVQWSFGTPKLNPKVFSGASALPNSTQRTSVELQHSKTQPEEVQWSFSTPKLNPKFIFGARLWPDWSEAHPFVGVFELINTICGASILGIGIYLKVTFNFSELMPSFPAMTVANGLFIIGIFITCVSFLGFLGALKENRCLLISFFTLMFLVMVGELALASFLLMYENTINDGIEKELMKSLEKQKNGTNIEWDAIQKTFHCCGVNNASDWQSIPTSCCSTTPCEKAGPYWKDGCYSKLKAWFDDNLLSTGIGVIIVCSIEVLGMCFAMTLFCHISKSGLGYKERWGPGAGNATALSEASGPAQMGPDGVGSQGHEACGVEEQRVQVLSVNSPVQRRFRGAALDFGQ